MTKLRSRALPSSTALAKTISLTIRCRTSAAISTFGFVGDSDTELASEVAELGLLAPVETVAGIDL